MPTSFSTFRTQLDEKWVETIKASLYPGSAAGEENIFKNPSQAELGEILQDLKKGFRRSDVFQNYRCFIGTSDVLVWAGYNLIHNHVRGLAKKEISGYQEPCYLHMDNQNRKIKDIILSEYSANSKTIPKATKALQGIAKVPWIRQRITSQTGFDCDGIPDSYKQGDSGTGYYLFMGSDLGISEEFLDTIQGYGDNEDIFKNPKLKEVQEMLRSTKLLRAYVGKKDVLVWVGKYLLHHTMKDHLDEYGLQGPWTAVYLSFNKSTKLTTIATSTTNVNFTDEKIMKIKLEQLAKLPWFKPYLTFSTNFTDSLTTGTSLFTGADIGIK